MATSIPVRPCVARILSQPSQAVATRLAPASIRPALLNPSSSFSTTTALEQRKPKRDNNRLRGISSIYRRPPRHALAADRNAIPLPADYKPEIKVDPNHGLWDFFYEKDKLLNTPTEEGHHGRSWTVEELRQKSWDDLHKLWWVCVKERNRIATAKRERKQLELKTGDEESFGRDKEVLGTMRAIRHTLTERFYVWEDARKLAESDSEIDLNNAREPYVPGSAGDYFEDATPSEAMAESEGVREDSHTSGRDSASENVDPSTLPSSSKSEQVSARP